jgi:hypothetical protein
VLIGLLTIAASTATASAAVEAGALSATVNSPGPATSPVAASRFGWFWTFLENTLHSRARMLQFGVIGVCIALYFMYRARG